MSNQTYHAPKTRSIILGIVLFILAVFAFLSLGDVIKLLGAPFLYLPHQLGILKQVSAAEILPLTMDTSPTRIELPAPGLYTVYTNDYDLLMISDEMMAKKNPPWLTITSLASNEKIPASFVERGLRLYDTPLAKGRPVIIFEIPAAGSFEIRHPRRPASVSILPDYTTGHEVEITMLFVLQLGVLGLPLFILLRSRFNSRNRRLKEIDGLKRIRGDEFWKNLKKQ
jgi:hypothetical protein